MNGQPAIKPQRGMQRPLAAGALELSEGALQRPDEGVFTVQFNGQVLPLNDTAAQIAATWRDEDTEIFAHAVIEADREERLTIEEIILGDPGAFTRLQVTTLRLSGTNGILCIARNVGLNREFYLALADSRRRYRDFAELSDSLQWETGMDGRFAFVSPRGGYGFSSENLFDMEPLSLLAERYDDAFNPFATRQAIERRDFWFWRRDGEIVPVQISAFPLHAPDGTWIGARGVCRDVSELRTSQTLQSEAQWHLDTLVGISRVLEVSGDQGLTPLLDIMRRAFNADGVQIAAQSLDTETSAASAWDLLGQSGMTEGTSQALQSVLANLTGPGVVVTTISGWKILAVSLGLDGGRAGALLFWRRVTLPGWGEDQKALAGSISPLIAVQVSRHLGRIRTTPAVEAPVVHQNAELIGRRLKRCLYAGHQGCLLTFDIPHTLASSDQARCVKTVLYGFVRASDLVLEISPTRFGVWLDHVENETARKRGEEMRLKLKSGLTGVVASERSDVVMQAVFVSPTDTSTVTALSAVINGIELDARPAGAIGKFGLVRSL